MRLSHLPWSVLLFITAFSTACQQATEEVAAAEGRKLRVLTSILPIYCFTANVAGDLAEVQNLLPGGVGPHEYQLSPADAKKLSRANLIILNGFGLDSWLTRSIQANRMQASAIVLEAAAGLDEALIGRETKDRQNERSNRRGLSAGLDRASPEANPHLWLDPRLAAHYVTNILAALQKADPPNANAYALNATHYLGRLEKLDADIGQALAPLKDQPFVTYHEAFPYFVRRYGLNQAGAVEKIPDVEPSPRELSALYQVIREKKVKVLFTEPQFSSKLARQISRDLNLSLAELDPLETGRLTPTAYEEGMRNNVQVLQKYLR